MPATVMAAVEDVKTRLTHTVTGSCRDARYCWRVLECMLCFVLLDSPSDHSAKSSRAGNARYTITGQNLGTCHQPRGCDFRGGHLEAIRPRSVQVRNPGSNTRLSNGPLVFGQTGSGSLARGGVPPVRTRVIRLLAATIGFPSRSRVGRRSPRQSTSP